MHTVLNLLLCVPYIAGLGLLITAFSPHIRKEYPADGPGASRLLALILMGGLLCDYALVLAVRSLDVALWSGVVLSGTGFAVAIIRHRAVFAGMLTKGKLSAVITGYLAYLVAIPIITYPLLAWDARSIWFFHAKMIYYTGSIGPDSGFTNPAFAFSHVQYPKLVPVIAAQLCHVAGFWNEYLPKVSLIVMLLPAVFAALSLIKRSTWWSSGYLIFILFFGKPYLLWNGYMDGYLAAYACIGSLFFARWLHDNDDLDAVAGIACFAMTMSLKNEGLALFAAAALACGWMQLRSGSLAAAGRLMRRRDFWVISGVCFAGTLLWAMNKGLWGLDQVADVAVIHPNRMIERFRAGEARLIVKALFFDTRSVAVIIIFLATILSAKALRIPVARSLGMPALAALLYSIILFLVYLNTPSDLAWHLLTSADRTTLPITLGFAASTYLILQSMELQFRPASSHARHNS